MRFEVIKSEPPRTRMAGQAVALMGKIRTGAGRPWGYGIPFRIPHRIPKQCQSLWAGIGDEFGPIGGSLRMPDMPGAGSRAITAVSALMGEHGRTARLCSDPPRGVARLQSRPVQTAGHESVSSAQAVASCDTDRRSSRRARRQEQDKRQKYRRPRTRLVTWNARRSRQSAAVPTPRPPSRTRRRRQSSGTPNAR